MLLHFLALAAPILAADTTRYVVDNHGREAGEMIVAASADSVVVRWVFTDRNRGTRVLTRYRLGPGGTAVAGEVRPVLADGSAGETTYRFELVGDSVRVQAGAAAPSMVARAPRAFVGVAGATPWDQAAFARYLLAQPDRSAPTSGGLASRAEVITDTALRGAGSARQRARLVLVYGGTSTNPNAIWLDERGQLLATGAG